MKSSALGFIRLLSGDCSIVPSKQENEETLVVCTLPVRIADLQYGHYDGC
jgi:hypothetical protein